MQSINKYLPAYLYNLDTRVSRAETIMKVVWHQEPVFHEIYCALTALLRIHLRVIKQLGSAANKPSDLY